MIYGIIQVRDLGALKVLKVQGEINANRYIKLGGHGLLSVSIETNFYHIYGMPSFVMFSLNPHMDDGTNCVKREKLYWRLLFDLCRNLAR